MDQPVFDAPPAASSSGSADAPADGAAAPASGSQSAGKLHYWASNLEENLDKRLLVLLRDGRQLVGWLRTFDQFANLLLEHAVERHVLVEERVYADVYLGTMLVRGENVCLFGELDPDDEEAARQIQGRLREAPLADVLRREAELEAEEEARGIKRPLDLFMDQGDM